MQRTRLGAGRVAASLTAWALVLPLCAWLTPTVAAALRHSLRLPLALALAIAGLIAVVAAIALVRALARPARVAPLLAAAALAAALLARVDASLLAPVGWELVTVGGGDLGHHLHIAALVAGPMPTAYVGFTGWHVSMVVAATLLRWGLLPTPALAPAAGTLATTVTPATTGSAATPWRGLELLDGAAVAVGAGQIAFVVAAAALVVALVWRAGARSIAAGEATRDSGHSSRRRTLGLTLGATVAAALALHAFDSYLFAALHYHAADGFVAHLHAAGIVVLGALAAICLPAGRLSVVAALAAVLLLRFDYGLNLPEHGLGFAALALIAARAEAPGRMRTALRVSAALAALAAVAMAAVLTSSWPKPGGMMHGTVDARLESLLPALIAAVGLWRWAARPSRYWLGWVLGVPLAVAMLHVASPALPAAYYFFKHGVHATWLLALVLAGLAGAGVARVIARGAADVGTGLRARDAALTSALALAAWALPGQLADADAAMMRGYRERAAPRWAWRQLAPLRTPLLAAVAAELEAGGGRIDAVLHPHWPVFSALSSMRDGWETLHFGPVKALQPLRWAAFVDGDPLRPGGCALVAASRAQRAAWASHDLRYGGRAGSRALAALAAADTRCAGAAPDAVDPRAARVCWRCVAGDVAVERDAGQIAAPAATALPTTAGP
jgi:hypothetical protein